MSPYFIAIIASSTAKHAGEPSQLPTQNSQIALEGMLKLLHTGYQSLPGFETGQETPAGAEDSPVRSLLVKVLQLSLDYWERTTQQTKADFVETSQIWKMHLDKEGTLRFRTLDRYLTTTTLPRKPRWRLILKTAYYVLNHCPEEPAMKKTLETELARLEKMLKSHTF